MSTTLPTARRRSRKRDAVRRRVRRVRSRLQESRKRTRLATAVAVLATVFAVVSALWPEPAPDPVLLGQGRAGVRATVESPRPAPASSLVDDSVRSDPDNLAVEGTPIAGGEASYYGEELEGNPTASGEPFRAEGLTAAHRTLPLGSRIRVTNLRNGESVVVRVNDRGPYAEDRVVDVSKAAAREIGLLRRGTGQVRIELIPRGA